MPLKLKWPYKYKLLKVASDGKFGRLEDFDFYWKNGKKIPLKHQGSDYRLPCGIPFYSPVKGKVDILEKRDYGYGYFVRIKFGIYHIGFAHNSRLDIRLGQTIKVGQLLGLTGSTGRGASCHSHVELRVHGKVVNPETMIQWIEKADMYAEKSKKYSDGKSRSAKSWFNAFVTEFKRKITARNKSTQVTSQLTTIKGQLKTLQIDYKRTLATMNDQSILLSDTREEVRILKEKLKDSSEGTQKREEVKSMEIFSKIPGKGSRTILSLLLLALVTIAKINGVGEDALSPELVDSVQAVLAVLTGIFYRLK